MTALLDTKLESRRLVNGSATNDLDTANGSQLISWMEQIGAMSAMRCASGKVMTVEINSATFYHPIPGGHIALIEAFAYDIGRSSITLWIRGYDEDPATGERELAADAFMVTVALDENGDTRPVEDLTVKSEKGTELKEAAINAKQGRMSEQT